MAKAIQDGQEYNGQEIIVERPDGGRLTVLAHANPILDDSGKLVGAVNVLVDISDRKRAEEAQARLAAIVESSDDAIISKTLEGRILQDADRLDARTRACVAGPRLIRSRRARHRNPQPRSASDRR